MKALRAELSSHAAPFLLPMIGWHAENPAPPCAWAYVGCDGDNRVTRMCACAEGASAPLVAAF